MNLFRRDRKFGGENPPVAVIDLTCDLCGVQAPNPIYCTLKHNALLNCYNRAPTCLASWYEDDCMIARHPYHADQDRVRQPLFKKDVPND